MRFTTLVILHQPIKFLIIFKSSPFKILNKVKGVTLCYFPDKNNNGYCKCVGPRPKKYKYQIILPPFSFNTSNSIRAGIDLSCSVCFYWLIQSLYSWLDG